jgi:Mrp family chromosome partitioning ATPase/tetratricopeptide (TPR) repeat protein
VSAPVQEPRAPGRVVTFYSYKGGTGRSMALANVAWILASNGKKVLAVDWDLEAPGLHRYFAPFLLDAELTSSRGLMDLLVDFAAATVSDPEEECAPDWYRPLLDRVLRYVSSLRWSFGEGTLDLLPAGRQGPQYGAMVTGFNWQRFYDEQGGGTFLDELRGRLCGIYDYVLIDSRTGVSDTAGICTVQMPDTLVACFTLNNQGIDGAAAVATSAFQQRSRTARPLQVLPVPTRVENAENDKLQARWELAKRRLSPFPLLEGTRRDEYWTEVAIRYKPYYAYEEILATFGDRPSDPIPLLGSMERLTRYITGGEVEKLVPPPESERLVWLDRYAGVAHGGDAQPIEEVAESVLGRMTEEQQEATRRLLTRLVEPLATEEGGGMRRIRLPMDALDESSRGVAAALLDAGLLTKVESHGRLPVVQLAHEDLPARWARLAAWVEGDREFLTWRRRVAAAAAEWEAEKDAAVLLTGERLRTALAASRSRSADLTPLEKRFIAASAGAGHPGARPAGVWMRSRRPSRIAAVVVGVGALAAVTGVWRIAARPADPFAIDRPQAALVEDARRLSSQGVYASALLLLDSAVQLDTTSAPVLVERGETRLRAGDEEGAARDLDRAVALNPRSARAYLSRAELHLGAADTGAAITTLRTAYAFVEDTAGRGSIVARLLDLHSRPVAPGTVVLGYAGAPRDSAVLAALARTLDRAGFPLQRPWIPANNTTAQVRYFRDDRRALADTVAAVVQGALDVIGVRVTMQPTRVDSLRYRNPPTGGVLVWLPGVGEAGGGREQQGPPRPPGDTRANR